MVYLKRTSVEIEVEEVCRILDIGKTFVRLDGNLQTLGTSENDEKMLKLLVHLKKIDHI